MDTAPNGNLLKVNGAKIYYEVRGSGSSVLFIAGATGDGGHFERVAEILSDEFTVVTYDRRANSRSPRPDGWESTSTEEHSEDAARLIEALDIAPAAVFGNSAGAIIGLDLVIRHPELVRGAILHEPPMTAGMSNPEKMMGAIQQVVMGGMQRAGPRGGVEAFWRFVAGDGTFENLEAAPIGGQLFLHDTSRSDCAPISPLLDTFATRLLAQALRLASARADARQWGDLIRHRVGRFHILRAGRSGARRRRGASAGYGAHRKRSSVLRGGSAVARRSVECGAGEATRWAHTLLQSAGRVGGDDTTAT
jgi:pimeloyl-ACP methyl ester carboxylesterase